MRLSARRLLVPCIVLSGSWGCGGDTPGGPEAFGSIQGILTAAGAGVPHVTVAVSGPEERSVTTDEAGEFDFSSLPVGTYTVSIADFPETLEFARTSSPLTVAEDATAQVEFEGNWMALEITTTGPPTNAVVGETYLFGLMAEGGDGAWTWSVAADALPDGLQLGELTGLIEGTPTAHGSWTFTIEVTSGDGQSASREYSLSVFEPLEITRDSLSNVLVGDPYVETLTATGGDGTFTWSVGTGELPAGLSLVSATGEISGTPTVSGSFTFTVVVTSGDGQTREVAYSIRVFAVLAIETVALSDPWIDEPYESVLEASGGDGVYTWTVVTGALPSGLELDAQTGALTGSASDGGTASFTVGVTSGDGQVAERAMSLEVVLGPDASCSGYPSDLVVTFEDAALEDLVREVLGLTTETDITCGALPEITALDGYDRGIADLSGIQNLVGMTRLSLQRNSVNDLTPVSTLTLLTQLTLPENQVASLAPLTGLSSLEILDIDTNQIEDLTPLAGLTALRILDVGRNLIADISPLEGLPNLSSLSVYENALTDIGAVSTMPSLSSLSIGDNSVSDLGPLSGNTTLVSLNIQYNPITSLTPLSSVTSLRRLWAFDCQISDIGPLANLSNLEVLWIHRNEITDVSPLVGLTQLSEILLTDNPVSDITPFSSMTWLTRLDLGRTPIPDLSPLSELVGLEALVLWDASITDLSPLANLTALTYLNVEDNAVTDLSVTEGMTQLNLVILRRNTSLSDVQPLLDNPGIGSGDSVYLDGTSVSCEDVSSLESKGVTVGSDCS